MAAPESALRQSREPHIHAGTETCPVCDQPIPNDKAKEVRARIDAQARRAAEAAEARANQRIAAEKARIEAASNQAVEKLRKEHEKALKEAATEAAAQLNSARAEGRKAAEAALQDKIAAAETARADAERSAAQKIAAADSERQKTLAQVQTLTTQKAQIEAASNEAVEKLRKEHEKALKEAATEAAAQLNSARAEARKAAEAALQDKIAAAETARADAERSAVQKIAAADSERQKALAQVQALTAQQDARVNERVREAREALEKDKADALAATKAANDAETRKLTARLETLQRQLEKQRADELGEGAEIKLFDALKEEFPADDIRRVKKGVSGADILHTVMHNGGACGTIIYDSKNSTAWRDDYVVKLVRDQTAAKADHATLSTFKFPAGASQLEVREGVVIVNPARAVAIARIIRKHLLHVHTLRLSKADRTKKMAALYDFITSERCALLLGRVDSETDALLELQATEMKAHQNHWKREGTLVRSIQKVKAELETEIDLIIGADEPAE